MKESGKKYALKAVQYMIAYKDIIPCIDIQSNSNSPKDRKNVRITTTLSYRDSNHRGFLLGDFQRTFNFLN